MRPVSYLPELLHSGHRHLQTGPLRHRDGLPDVCHEHPYSYSVSPPEYHPSIASCQQSRVDRLSVNAPSLLHRQLTRTCLRGTAPFQHFRGK